MDVAGPILHPQDLSGLSQMSQDGIVGGIFTVMRIKSPKRPRYAGSRSNHTAVNIQSQTPQPLLQNGLTDYFTVEFHQSLKRLVGESLEPAGHAAFTRQTQQSTKSLHQRIFAKIIQMIEPSATDQNQHHDHQDHIDGPVVSAHAITGKNRLHPTMKLDQPKERPISSSPPKAVMSWDANSILKKPLHAE